MIVVFPFHTRLLFVSLSKTIIFPLIFADVEMTPSGRCVCRGGGGGAAGYSDIFTHTEARTIFWYH